MKTLWNRNDDLVAPAARLAGVAGVLLLAGLVAGGILVSGAWAAPKGNAPAAVTMRVAHMPNVTHSPALVGRVGGEFEKAVAPAKVDWKVFNAGPSMIEALFAGELDMAYIGPNPALNGYVKSRGEAVRLVSGVCEGGAALVGRKEAGFLKADDLKGRRIATPQLGNTQDISLRHWITTHGRKTSDKGGDVTILPMANPDHLTMFLKKEIDGSWTVEPWVSRLVREAGGVILLDERTIWSGGRNPTTVVIVRTEFLQKQPDLVRRWLSAEEDLMGWMKAHPDSAQARVNRLLDQLTGKPLPPGLIEECWTRLNFASDPCIPAILEGANWARDAGFLKFEGLDLKGLFSVSLLNQVRKERGLPEVK